jgi:hypothetical protein
VAGKGPSQQQPTIVVMLDQADLASPARASAGAIASLGEPLAGGVLALELS